MQLGGERERAAQVEAGHYPRGIRQAWVLTELVMYTTAASGTIGAVPRDERQRCVAHGDHDVEPAYLVLPAKEVLERIQVGPGRKSPLIDVLGVVVEPLREAFAEDARQLALAHDGHLGVPPVEYRTSTCFWRSWARAASGP